MLGEVEEEESLHHSAADLVIHLRPVRIPKTSVCVEDRSALVGLYQYLSRGRLARQGDTTQDLRFGSPRVWSDCEDFVDDFVDDGVVDEEVSSGIRIARTKHPKIGNAIRVRELTKKKGNASDSLVSWQAAWSCERRESLLHLRESHWMYLPFEGRRECLYCEDAPSWNSLRRP
jgi:hypothetical protein